MEKEGEPEAEEGEDYVLVSFMERTGTKAELLKWPRRSDILNVLKVSTVPTVPYLTIPSGTCTYQILHFHV
jgi:hypothetical protein